MRSHVWGNVKLDTTRLIDRKVVRFMATHPFMHSLLSRQSQVPRLSSGSYQNNPRVGLIAGSRDGPVQVFGADAMRRRAA
ncbi:hypothetical protein ACVXG9_23080 [Escherichia coli]